MTTPPSTLARLVAAPLAVQSHGRTLVELVPVFLKQFRIVRQRRPETIRAYQGDLSVFLTFCSQAGLVSPDHVRVQHLEIFLGWLVETRGVQPSTVARYRAALKALWEWLEHEELVTRNPAAKTYAPKQRKRLTRSLSLPQQDRLFATLADDPSPRGLRDYAILATLGFAGLRASEVGALTMEHLDLECGTLAVIEGKGAKDRLVPVLPPLDSILARYLTHARPVLLRGRASSSLFISHRHRPLGSRGVWNLTRRTLKRVLGIADGHPHQLRHALGFRLHEHGASPLDIRDMLGHESIRTTERYIKTVGESQRARLAGFINGAG